MSQQSNVKIFYALSFAWQLGFLIAVPIGGFVVLGIFGDHFFKTQPLFLLLGIIIGCIITSYEVYHLLMPLIQNNEKNDTH